MTARMYGQVSAQPERILRLKTLYHGVVCLYKGKVAPEGSELPPSQSVPRDTQAIAEVRETLAVIMAGRPPTGGAKQSAASLARRADIIAAAIRVIARDGIRACTVSALERETSFARGHFTYHVRSKEEIIGLAFATVGADWIATQARAAADAAGAARLEQRIRAAVAWVQKRPAYFLCLMNFRVEMMRDASLFPLAPQFRAQIWDVSAEMIREGVVTDEFHPRTDPAIEARILFATIDGMLMHSAMDPDYCPREELADRIWEVVATRLGYRVTIPGSITPTR